MSNFDASICTWGLSDIKWLDVKRTPSPQMQFNFTWLVETKDGKQFGQSTPGFRYIKNNDGSYSLRPPTARMTAHATYYASTITLDLMDAIEKYIIENGYREKTGANTKTDELLKLPVEY